MRWGALLCAVLVAGLPLGWTEEGAAEKTEADKWAAEENLDAVRLGQTDMGLSAIGRLELSERDWMPDELRDLVTIDAGVFHATKLLRKQGWVDRSAALPVRLANAGLLDWIRRNPGLKLVQATGRLRVDGKYFLIEDCRPAEEKPVVAPVLGRSKRSGL